jgi:4-alpha-glucanotransferase
VNEKFGEEAVFVKKEFLSWNDGVFELRPEFDTQRKVEQYFNHQPKSETNQLLKGGLFDLISNVIFFVEEDTHNQQFIFELIWIKPFPSGI